MTELKGVDKLNREITSLLNNALHTDLDYVLGTDFCYYLNNEQVQYTVFMMNKSDDYWKEFIERRFDLKLRERDMWIFSILHEIGHHNTLWNVSDFDYKKAQLVKKLIERKFVGGTRFANMIYFGLADEIVATAWAVRFFKKHKIVCRQVSEQVFGLIREFLDENGVTE